MNVFARTRFPQRSVGKLAAFSSNYPGYRSVTPEEIGGGLAGAASMKSLTFLLSPLSPPSSLSTSRAFLPFYTPTSHYSSVRPFSKQSPRTPTKHAPLLSNRVGFHFVHLKLLFLPCEEMHFCQLYTQTHTSTRTHARTHSSRGGH